MKPQADICCMVELGKQIENQNISLQNEQIRTRKKINMHI